MIFNGWHQHESWKIELHKKYCNTFDILGLHTEDMVAVIHSFLELIKPYFFRKKNNISMICLWYLILTGCPAPFVYKLTDKNLGSQL